MNLLGIDFGSKRVGLAVGSSESKLASPLDTLDNNPSLITRLRDIAAKENIGKIVVGLPRGLDGQSTTQTHVVSEFVKALQTQLQLPVTTIDEAVTSEMARERLGKDAPKSDIDKEAATIILQDYLDGQTKASSLD